VKFKDFFLADILTSMIYPLRDVILICFFFGTGQWLQLEDKARYMDPTRY